MKLLALLYWAYVKRLPSFYTYFDRLLIFRCQAQMSRLRVSDMATFSGGKCPAIIGQKGGYTF